MIVERDLKVLRHLEQYRYATIPQLEKIIFRAENQNYSYNICRRRLAELRKVGHIKHFRDVATNKYVYCLNEAGIKPPSMSRLIILDLYAEMVGAGFEIEIFDIEKFWNGGKIRSDAFVVFFFEGYRYHFFVEVQLSNHHHNLEKYDELYHSHEVQNFYMKAMGKEYYPKILLITDKEYSKIDVKSTPVKVLDTKLNNFSKILL